MKTKRHQHVKVVPTKVLDNKFALASLLNVDLSCLVCDFDIYFTNRVSIYVMYILSFWITYFCLISSIKIKCSFTWVLIFFILSKCKVDVWGVLYHSLGDLHNSKQNSHVRHFSKGKITLLDQSLWQWYQQRMHNTCCLNYWKHEL